MTTDTCTLCAPAPIWPMRRTAVCADCVARHGQQRALDLAGLRRHDGRLAATSRREGGRWRRVPTSGELAALMRRARHEG